MIIDSWNVYWTEYAAYTYLYGSKLTFHKKDDIEYENHMMPPGSVIKEWYSKTNYQREKVEPSLPMIDGESRYQIETQIDCLENESFLMRLVFFDRFENEVSSISFRDKIKDFQCPLRTYSYKLQLINGGMTAFHFHSIIIREIMNEDEDEEEDKTTE